MIRRVLRRLLARHDEAVLIPDTALVSDADLIEVAPGKYMAIGDYGRAVVYLRDRDGNYLDGRAEQ